MSEAKFAKTGTYTLATMAEDSAKAKRKVLPWFLRWFLADWLDSLIEILNELAVRIQTERAMRSLYKRDDDYQLFMNLMDEKRESVNRILTHYDEAYHKELRLEFSDFLTAFDQVVQRYQRSQKP